MPSFGGLGRMLMVLGAILLAAGGLITLAGKIPGLGKLPGDIVIQRGNFNFYFPLTTSILLSIILTLVFALLGRK